MSTTLLVETTVRVEHRAVDPKDLDTALRQDREAAALRTDVLPPEVLDPSIPPPVSWRWVPLWVRVPWSGRGASLQPCSTLPRCADSRRRITAGSRRRRPSRMLARLRWPPPAHGKCKRWKQIGRANVGST